MASVPPVPPSTGVGAAPDADSEASAPVAGGRRSAAGAAKPGRTRAGTAWAGVTTTVVLLVLLIVFIAQNGRQVRISFLWMDGSFPLALALLVAAVAGALVAVIAGSARIVQLRRRLRR